MRKTLIAVALAVAPVLAAAQGGMMHRGMMDGGDMMGGGMMPDLASLELSDGQRERVFAIQESARKRNSETMSKARAEMLETLREARRQIEAVLTPEQRKQLGAPHDH